MRVQKIHAQPMAVIGPIIRGVRRQIKGLAVPSVAAIAVCPRGRRPYLVLVSCIISLRTKDRTTIEAADRLFAAADNPHDMMRLSRRRIESLIYPACFFRTKARVIRDLSRKLCRESGGKVPDSLQGLLALKGVGLKTANLVLGLGFGIPAICVDTHVHRIANRLGWVSTASPEETEMALRKLLPRKYWIGINTELVAFGQNYCTPVSPRCGVCFVRGFCARSGVKKSR